VYLIRCRNAVKPFFLRAGIFDITRCTFKKVKEALDYIALI
jgi:hypothetical protein